MSSLYCVLLLLLSSFLTTTWAVKDLLGYRHSIHLTVNKADNPELSLKNLERVANSLLDRTKRKRQRRLINPYYQEPVCDPHSHYRTIDGTCNNLARKWIGAAKTPLSRLAPHRYQDGYNSARSNYFHSKGKLPTARKVSVSLTMTRSNISSKHSHLLMNYGQFIDHDLTLSPESGGEGGQEAEKRQCCDKPVRQHRGKLKECLPIFTHRDPVFQRTCIPFLRSAAVPPFPGFPAVRHQLNDLTAYIDGSQVYGNTKLKATSLRQFVGGKLKTSIIKSKEHLPSATDNPSNCMKPNAECQFAAGDIRSSEQAGLTSLHVLFLREHNRIADELSSLNLHWSDETLYQEARKIVGAVLQRITYNEWLPEIIGPKLMLRYGLSVSDYRRFFGYSSKVDASIMTEFSSAAFRFGHSLVRQTFSAHPTTTVELSTMFKAFKTIHKHGADSFVSGLAEDRVERCDRFIAKGLRDELFGEEADLLSFNIQRGRDHGIASYSDIRKSLNLPVLHTYNSMSGYTHSMSMTNDFSKVYPSPEDIEAFPGGVTEIPLKGAVVGETFANLIALQFYKLKYGDRFWHERPASVLGFNNDQLREIKKITFATLYCENIAGVKVRAELLRMESAENPVVDCKHIPRLDLRKWKA